MIKWLTSRLFRQSLSNPDTVIIKVKINDHYTFYYPFTAKDGMKVRVDGSTGVVTVLREGRRG